MNDGADHQKQETSHSIHFHLAGTQLNKLSCRAGYVDTTAGKY